MTLSLRERRRLQTARDIQASTLKLAESVGLDGVTTDAIAEHAGISTRTFFNYYPNKEAAVLGLPPDPSDAAKTAFQKGQGPLADDLRLFIQAHLDAAQVDRTILRKVTALSASNPKVRLLHDELLLNLSDVLSGCIATRAPDLTQRQCSLLADSALRMSVAAVDLWVSGEAEELYDALARVWTDYRIIAGVLFGTCDGSLPPSPG